MVLEHLGVGGAPLHLEKHEMTIDINELRMLTQDFKLAGSPMFLQTTQMNELLDRLEAAEKDVALKEQVIDALGSELNAVANERDALRAKIERMEKQEPVWWQARTRPTWNDGTWLQWRKCSEEYAQDIKKTPLLHDWLYEARALYALPGAQTQGEEK